MSDRHPLERELNASASDILSAVQLGFRTVIDVKGKLGELFMDRHLATLRDSGLIEAFERLDKDGEPDFTIRHRGRDLRLECKLARSGSQPKRWAGSHRVELQRTRNSKDGQPTRAYRSNHFEVLAVCLFNQTGKWDFLYIATKKLQCRPQLPEYLEIMHRVPTQAEGAWKSDLLEALKEA